MQVDNPLVEVCDPLFIGYHLAAAAEVSTQVVAKHNPRDRVGNVVSIDGQVQIIEYSDLPDDVAEQRLPDGSLKLWAGSIAVHVFDVTFVEKMSSGGGQLPFHFARKKVPYVDSSGQSIEPAEPNAIKFEQFIFDLFPAAQGTCGRGRRAVGLCAREECRRRRCAIRLKRSGGKLSTCTAGGLQEQVPWSATESP